VNEKGKNVEIMNVEVIYVNEKEKQETNRERRRDLRE
jgi:hypothetical protein